jgi:hypothetical protein
MSLKVLMRSWTRYLYLYLVSNSTHGEEFEVQSRNFLTWIEGLKLKSIQISFGLPRIWLAKDLMCGQGVNESN